MPSQEELDKQQLALADQEHALVQREQQQADTQERLSKHQHQVADQERANRLKTKELMLREQKLDDEKRVLHQEQRAVDNAKQQAASAGQQRSALVIPLLLIVCIVAGFYAFNHIEQQEKYFKQVTAASENIDKLARILSFTQDEVVMATSQLSTKKVELERTKLMLHELKQTTDQLQWEIVQLKNGYAVNNNTVNGDKASAITLSANTISAQLAELKAQLDDKHLMIDIDEAYIESQEHDLKEVQSSLKTKEDVLAQHQLSMTKKEAEISKLKEIIAQLSDKTPADTDTAHEAPKLDTVDAPSKD